MDSESNSHLPRHVSNKQNMPSEKLIFAKFRHKLI